MVYNTIMKNTTLNVLTILLLSTLFLGCAGHLHLPPRDNLGCLGDIAVKPYGLDVRVFLVPQEIEKKLGKPLAIENIPVIAGDYNGVKTIYKYDKASFYFMRNDYTTALYSVEIIQGQIGCLKIGESKKEYVSKFGPTSDQNYDQKTFYIKRDIKDSVEMKFGLYIEFKDNHISLIRPDFGEIFKNQED